MRLFLVNYETEPDAAYSFILDEEFEIQVV
jgi:hypothetical protein